MKDVDKYFRAKANYEAASRGLGGRHAAVFWRFVANKTLFLELFLTFLYWKYYVEVTRFLLIVKLYVLGHSSISKKESHVLTSGHVSYHHTNQYTNRFAHNMVHLQIVLFSIFFQRDKVLLESPSMEESGRGQDGQGSRRMGTQFKWSQKVQTEGAGPFILAPFRILYAEHKTMCYVALNWLRYLIHIQNITRGVNLI